MSSLDELISAELDRAGVPVSADRQALKDAERQLSYLKEDNHKLKAKVQELRKNLQESKEATGKAQSTALRGMVSSAVKSAKTKSNGPKHQGKKDTLIKTIKTPDERLVLQLLNDSVQLHSQEQCYTLSISCTELSKQKDGIPKFCMPLLNAALEIEPYGDWARKALIGMGRMWRRDNNRVRIDDLDLPKKTIRLLQDQEIVFVKDLKNRQLHKLPGIGPKTVESINAAVDKGPIDIPGEKAK